MAQHDFVIDNSTGQNVRSDVNNVLKAILTNNSGTTDPSTVIAGAAGSKAFSFWADTNSSPAVLKIRNAADNAWIELFQLDGTLTLEDGSASSPALSFRDDLNTGIYSSAPDTFNIATGGVERMELGTTTVFNEDGADVDFRIEGDTENNLFYVDAGNGRIGIRTNTPSYPLHVNSGAANSVAIFESTDAGVELEFKDSTGTGFLECQNDFRFKNSSGEMVRIDSSGNVGIGTSSPNVLGNDAQHTILSVIETSGTRRGQIEIGGNQNVTGAGIGDIHFVGHFQDANHKDMAAIKANADGSTSGQRGAYLAFETKTDGAAGITQAMRIRSDQRIVVGTSTGTGYTGKFGIHGSTDLLDLNSSSSSGAGKIKFYEGGAGRMNIETLGGTAGLLIYDSLNAASRVKIGSSGHVAINKTDELDGGTTGHLFRSGSTSPNMTTTFNTSAATASTYHLFNTNATNNSYRFYVQANGGVANHSGNNQNLSDERMKKNITNMGSVYDIFKQFVFKDFNYISDDDSESKKHGLIAQEVETIDADLITDSFKTTLDSEGNPIYRKGFKEEQFMMIGFKALQEAIAKIEVLETKVAALEAA